MPDERVFNSEYGNEIDSIHALVKIGYVSSDFGFQSANVQRFIHRNDLHFDLVINEEFFHDSWLMFAHKFNAPIITISEQLFVKQKQNYNIFDGSIPIIYRYLWNI